MKYHSHYSHQQEQIEELLHSILDGSTEYAIIVTDIEDNIILWNKGAENIYGYSPREMLGKQIPMDLLHRSDSFSDDILFSNNDTFRTNVIDYRIDAISKDGANVPVSVTVTKRTNKDNEPIGFLVIVRDITYLKLQEQFRDTHIEITHLANSSTEVNTMCNLVTEAISKLLDIPVVFICLLDEQDNKFYIASEVGLTSDYTSHCCTYTASETCVPESNKDCFYSYFQMTINSGKLSEHSIDKHIVSRDFNGQDFSIVHIPLLSDIALIGLMHIIIPQSRKQFLLNETQILSLIANEIAAGIQRKRLEAENRQYADNLARMVDERTDELREKDAQLVQSGKLATLGEMATGIAHEINQPLGAINLMAQGLLMAKRKNKCTDEILDNKLNAIVEQIDRISKIIAHLRTFARQSNDLAVEVNINNPLTDVFKLIGEQLNTHNILVEIDLRSDLPSILADHNKLEQVFLNIIGNARDALDDFELKINEIRNLEGRPEWVDTWEKKIIIRSYEHNGFVYAEICDNAGGIPENLINKIFEPFYTTKEVGKGTGLGLSISYGIIKEFSGTIEVASREMDGSCFKVKIPVMNKN